MGTVTVGDRGWHWLALGSLHTGLGSVVSCGACSAERFRPNKVCEAAS